MLYRSCLVRQYDIERMTWDLDVIMYVQPLDHTQQQIQETTLGTRTRVTAFLAPRSTPQRPPIQERW